MVEAGNYYVIGSIQIEWKLGRAQGDLERKKSPDYLLWQS